MQTLGGPSVRIMFELAGSMMEVSATVLTDAWKRWLGPHRFSRKLARLERAGFVTRPADSSGNERVIRLTEAGRLVALGGRDPLAHWARPWDGLWRVVVFDVQESKRTDRIRLQRQLRRLWFGYLQDSVWIGPDPVDALREAIEGPSADAATLTFIEGRPCGGETNADVVQGAWDFGRINRYYDDYLEILRSRSASLGGDARRDWMQTEWDAWCRAVRSDPLLPRMLLPAIYRGREALERRQEKMRHMLGLP